MLGIDPGSRRTGWGVVRQDGSLLRLVAAGVLEPAADQALHLRLAFLHLGMRRLLETHRPDVVGVESVFHGPNTRSLVVLGQARGALLATVGEAGVELVDLSPAEVKKALTGRGGARKDQLAHMVRAMLGTQAERLDGVPDKLPLDATDALGVAIATLHRRRIAGLARG
ncbi:MAG: crossover junction endodeoxyribonuclease RuvC [Planctomycetes bacterium]|nr:crossover junction endodeoxyribonuclease RuvC [Planctomycetota bacterium]